MAKVLEHALALPFFGIGMIIDIFQSCGHCWVFQICWDIECSTFTASPFRIWNSSTGISSPPLALFVRPTWLHIPGCLVLGEWSHHRDYPGREDLFCTDLKLQWGITSQQSEWPSSKSLQTINAGDGVEKREHSCTVDGNVNWYSHYGRWYGNSFKN